jgi:hypothetical protein
MTTGRSPRPHPVLLAGVVVLQLWTQSIVAAQSVPLAAPSDDKALAGLRSALDGYVALRTRIRGEVPPLRVTPNAQEIAARSDALARAVTRARRNAAQGGFFDASAAAAIRRTLAAALAAGDEPGIRALLDEDMTSFNGVRVHARYPVGFVLASTPPTLLHALPPLPPQLEYRFIGRTLILRDIEAALIVDYLPDALSAR